jgi:hypothetical protein
MNAWTDDPYGFHRRLMYTHDGRREGTGECRLVREMNSRENDLAFFSLWMNDLYAGLDSRRLSPGVAERRKNKRERSAVELGGLAGFDLVSDRVRGA